MIFATDYCNLMDRTEFSIDPELRNETALELADRIAGHPHAPQILELRLLCEWILLSVDDIDKRTDSSEQSPPDWWMAMQKLRRAAVACKEAL